MISSPSDYPRAYICDECIAVCNSIIEDDRAAGTPGKKFPVRISLEGLDGVLYMTQMEVEQLRDSLDNILASPSPESPAETARQSTRSVEQ